MNFRFLPRQLDAVEGVELVLLGIVAGHAEGHGIGPGGQLGLQAQDFKLCHWPHVDGVVNHGGDF